MALQFPFTLVLSSMILFDWYVGIFNVSGFERGSLHGTGSFPPSHCSGGRGSESDMGILCWWSLLPADTSEELLDRTSECLGLCVSLPDMNGSGLICTRSSPSTFSAGLFGSREQHALGAESTAGPESSFGGGGTSLAGLPTLGAEGTAGCESGFAGGIWAWSLKLHCGCLGPPTRGPGLRSTEMRTPSVFGVLVTKRRSPLPCWLF